MGQRTPPASSTARRCSPAGPSKGGDSIMAIYAAKQTPDFKMVLVLPDGDASRVPAGYTIERTEPGKVQVHVPVIRIGYWGWSWEFCLSCPSGWTGAARLAFR